MLRLSDVCWVCLTTLRYTVKLNAGVAPSLACMQCMLRVCVCGEGCFKKQKEERKKNTKRRTHIVFVLSALCTATHINNIWSLFMATTTVPIPIPFEMIRFQIIHTYKIAHICKCVCWTGSRTAIRSCARTHFEQNGNMLGRRVCVFCVVFCCIVWGQLCVTYFLPPFWLSSFDNHIMVLSMSMSIVIQSTHPKRGHCPIVFAHNHAVESNVILYLILGHSTNMFQV